MIITVEKAMGKDDSNPAEDSCAAPLGLNYPVAGLLLLGGPAACAPSRKYLPAFVNSYLPSLQNGKAKDPTQAPVHEGEEASYS